MLTYKQGCERFEELRATYWSQVKRAECSLYTKNERMRREAAARRFRVGVRRTWEMLERDALPFSEVV